jgi:hypothetical protein
LPSHAWNKSPAMMALADITPDLIMAFLDHLERQRHNRA